MSLLRLTQYGKTYRAQVRARPFPAQVVLELHRDDCKGGPRVELTLEEAADLLRQLQGARDEAYRLAKAQAKQVRAIADKNAAVNRAVERVARALEDL